MQTEAHNTAEIQRETIRQLQEKYDTLQIMQSHTEAQVVELKAQLSWERLQNKNQVESLKKQLEDKEARLLKFQKETELKLEVAKIQAQVKDIYAKNNPSVQNTLHEVANRARSPGGIRYTMKVT